MAQTHEMLMFGGMLLAIIGIGFLIATGIYTGVTQEIDGWFWSLLSVGAALLIIGVILMFFSLYTQPKSSAQMKQ